jgi:hypothetical protein
MNSFQVSSKCRVKRSNNQKIHFNRFTSPSPSSLLGQQLLMKLVMVAIRMMSRFNTTITHHTTEENLTDTPNPTKQLITEEIQDMAMSTPTTTLTHNTNLSTE